MRRGLLLFLAVALVCLVRAKRPALTSTPATPAADYDEAVTVCAVVLGDGITLDTYEGNREDVLSLHKYAYCYEDPVDHTDPSGNDIDSLMDMRAGSSSN